MINIGRYRHLITIQTPTVTPSAAGNAKSWATLTNGQRWAMIKPISVEERMYGDQVRADVTHRIYTRYLSTITPKMRVSFESRTFTIVGVINQDERDWVTIMECVEDVN